MTFIKTDITKYKEISDKEIIIMILEEGRKDLLEIIYDRYVSKVYYKASALINDKELGKDLTHDIMVKVLLNLSKYKGEAPFSLWVHSITYNYCMDYLRKQKRKKTNNYDEEYFSNIESDNSELENKKLKEMRITQLETLFTQLHPEEKVIMMMRYKDGLSIRSISEVLKVNEGAVKMRLKRCREKLLKLIKESGYEE